MSPEILLGFDFDERTDVFSLGIIVRSFTGEPGSRADLLIVQFAEIISRTLVDIDRDAFTVSPKILHRTTCTRVLMLE
jgi:hypothetical protein